MILVCFVKCCKVICFLNLDIFCWITWSQVKVYLKDKFLLKRKEMKWKQVKIKKFYPNTSGVVHNMVKVSYVWILNVLWWLFFVFEKHLVQRYPIYFPYENGPHSYHLHFRDHSQLKIQKQKCFQLLSRPVFSNKKNVENKKPCNVDS